MYQTTLEPVLGYNSNGTYTKKYTLHEIGASYPKSHRPPLLGEELPVEESGNILILVYTYSTTAGFWPTIRKEVGGAQW